MITNNPMQLKAFIKKKAKEKHISAQLVMQNYMLERFLERISLSPYKTNCIALDKIDFNRTVLCFIMMSEIL